MLLDDHGMLMEDADGVKDVVKNHFEHSFAKPQYNWQKWAISLLRIDPAMIMIGWHNRLRRINSRRGCGVVTEIKAWARMVLIYRLSSSIGMC